MGDADLLAKFGDADVAAFVARAISYFICAEAGDLGAASEFIIFSTKPLLQRPPDVVGRDTPVSVDRDVDNDPSLTVWV